MKPREGLYVRKEKTCIMHIDNCKFDSYSKIIYLNEYSFYFHRENRRESHAPFVKTYATLGYL